MEYDFEKSLVESIKNQRFFHFPAEDTSFTDVATSTRVPCLPWISSDDLSTTIQHFPSARTNAISYSDWKVISKALLLCQIVLHVEFFFSSRCDLSSPGHGIHGLYIHLTHVWSGEAWGDHLPFQSTASAFFSQRTHVLEPKFPDFS